MSLALERFALDILQGDIRVLGDLSHLVDTTDVRMINPRLSPRLAEKPRSHLLVRLQDELDRYDAVELSISGPKDQAHAPLTEEVK
jgi:hypothetical protein